MLERTKYVNGDTYYAVTSSDNPWEITYIGWLNAKVHIFCITYSIDEELNAELILYDTEKNLFGYYDTSDDIEYPMEVYDTLGEAERAIKIAKRIKEARAKIASMSDEELLKLLGD